MISAKYKWHMTEAVADEAYLAIAKQLGLKAEVAHLAYGRGIDSPEKLEAFLKADLSQLHDPFLLHDMAIAVERINMAIASGERILVYGDYDVDGMTSASIVKETLEMLGADVEVYLPNRFTDGYGPNQSVYQYFIEQQKISLIVTVDNGVSGHEALAYAKTVGVDVIVTDHHGLPAQLPEAYAIIHPEHPNTEYPFPYLAGCGVAFKLAWALLGELPTDLLDLVAIGTIADMVSLTDENRVMVKAGLQILQQTERFGLQELLVKAGLSTSDVTEETIGFTIAPQLNALGRLDDPNPAIELLTGFDDEEASQIARMIQDKNDERKELVQTIYDEALLMVDRTSPVQVLASEGWHPGVLGIVAGRLLEQLGQPVIVLDIKDGKAKGSGRSLPNVNLFEAMTASKELFDTFGGHSGAAGMTLPVDNLDRLRADLAQYLIDRGLEKPEKPDLQIDGRLNLGELSLETLKSLNKLAPFGMNHKKPVFLLEQIKVATARTMGQNSAHLKLKINQAGVDCDVIAFNKGHLLQEFQQAQGLELAVSLSVNQWNGATTIQLMLEDARVEGIQLFDVRAKSATLPKVMTLPVDERPSSILVVETVPNSLAELSQLFKNRDLEAVYFKNTIKDNFYLCGYGKREQFAKLYKTIQQFPEIDIRHKFKELAQFVNINSILLVKMIQIFEELGFVTIADGIMRPVKDAPHQQIESSRIYQELKDLVAFQELMALGRPQEIYQAVQDYLASEEE